MGSTCNSMLNEHIWWYSTPSSPSTRKNRQDWSLPHIAWNQQRRLSIENNNSASTIGSPPTPQQKPQLFLITPPNPKPRMLPEINEIRQPDNMPSKRRLSRGDSIVLSSAKSVKVKSLKAIIQGDEKLNQIRQDMHQHLANQYAAEGIEFMYEMQRLRGMKDNDPERHNKLDHIVKNFILPDAPREICFPGELRQPIMDAWEIGNDDDTLHSLLEQLAHGPIFADMVQNSGFQQFVSKMLEEGTVGMKDG